MDKVIYSKFSYERSPELDIRTNIVENDKGERYVEKIPYTGLAEEHVSRIYDWYVELEHCFENTKFAANKCEKTENGVRFEYLKGESMEHMLDGLILNGEIEKAVALIDEYVEEIRLAYQGSEEFVTTPEFENIFGELKLDKLPQAAAYVNIDLIFQNVIIDQGKWNVIDYEWTFGFPIPVNFMIYRALFYYTYQKEERRVIDVDSLYEKYGIGAEEKEMYRKMEDHFQRLYLQGQYHPLRNMNVSVGKNIMIMARIDDRCEAEELSRDIQIYWDLGRGFLEEDSRRFPYDEGEEICVREELPEGTKKIRADLSDERCIIHLLEFSAYDGEWYPLALEKTNGKKMSEDTYAFTTVDGWFIFEDLRENTTMFRVRFVKEKTAELSKSEKEDLDKEINELTIKLDQTTQELKQVTGHRDNLDQHRVQLETRILQLEKDKTEYNDMVQAYREDAAMWNQKYLMLTGSFSWRITKPIRKVIDRRKLAKLGRMNKDLEKNFVARCQEIGAEAATEELRRSHLADYLGYFTEVTDCVGDGKRFSVLLPLCNPTEEVLWQTIQMFLVQGYKNWELMILDYSDVEHGYTRPICQWLTTKFPQIRYHKATAEERASDAYTIGLNEATGDYFGICYQGDLISRTALGEFANELQNRLQDDQQQSPAGVFSDEGVFKEKPGDLDEPMYKCDFAPDTLASSNYVGQMLFLSTEWIKKTGGLDTNKAGAQFYDLLLKADEEKAEIRHIQKCLYYHRRRQNDWMNRLETEKSIEQAEKEAITEHAARNGYQVQVERTDSAFRSYHVSYEIKGEPLISIIIPNKDHTDDLDHCIKAIEEKSTYRNFEFIVVENCSDKPETFVYYKELEKRENVKVVYWKNGFNYSAINNFGFKHASGDYILLLNNDIEVITPGWLEEMLMFVQRPDVGAAGAMLYYPDNTIQHAGVILGLNGVAGHSHRNYRRGDEGYIGRLKVAQDLTGVTAACLMVKREVFEQVKGLDEDFKVAFNDVDFCMKIRDAGNLIVFTPFAELYHFESKSRGLEDSPEKVKRFMSEILKFKKKWTKELEDGDPYYNFNLTMNKENFTVADEEELQERNENEEM